MSDLLVGCKIIYNDGGDEDKSGIIVKVDRGNLNKKIAWILKPDGTMCYFCLDGEATRISPDDVNFIYALNKKYKMREEILANKVDRLHILDL